MSKARYVVKVDCLDYEDAKKTRHLIELRLGYKCYIDEEARA